MPLSRHEQISLNLHFLVKQELLSDPDKVISIGKSNLKRWKGKYEREPTWMKEWSVLLAQGVSAIASILEGLDEKSILLRSSSPFTGIVSQKERMEIIKKCKG